MAEYGFNTLAVHAGAQPDPATGARATPIYQTTAFVFEDADHAAALFNLQVFGNIYSRIMNPTNAVLEERVAALENGRAALSCGSGPAAQLLALHTLMGPGDNIVAARQLYGGSINQFSHGFAKFDWHVSWADAKNPDSFKPVINDRTKAIFVESIANPGGIITDIEKVAKIAHDAGVPLIVDNTLASPYLIRPIEWGADIIVHSATKYLGGHGTAIGGVIVDAGNFDYAADPEKFPGFNAPDESYNGLVFARDLGVGSALGAHPAFILKARVQLLRDLGSSLSPFNAFLIAQGLETLSLRVERHVENAQKVAEFLESHADVESVAYAGLPSSPWYERGRKYGPKGTGSVIAFEIAGGLEAGKRFVDGLELHSHVANIGDVRSLVIHPA